MVRRSLWTVPALLIIAGLVIVPAGPGSSAGAGRTPGALTPLAVPGPRDPALPAISPRAGPPASALSTQFSLALDNDSTFVGNLQTGSLTDAWTSAYDPVLDRWYLSSAYAVEVIDPSTFRPIANLPVPGRAGTVAVDPLHQRVYVANGTDAIEVFNSTSLTAVGTIALPAHWLGTDLLGVDPAQERMVAVSPYNATSLLIDLALERVIGTVPLDGRFVSQFVYDPLLGELLTGNVTDATIDEVDTGTATVTGTLSAGGGEVYGLATDPSGTDVYAAGPGLGIALVSALNGTRLAHDPNGSQPGGIAYDERRGEVLMADAEANRLTAFGPANLTPLWWTNVSSEASGVFTPIDPVDAPALDSVLLPTGYLDTLDAISLANHTVYRSLLDRSFPESIVEDSACGCYVVGDSVGSLIYFVDPATFRIEREITTTGEVNALLYAPNVKEIFAATWGFPGTSYGIEILNGTTGSEIKFLPGLSYPDAFAYDSASGAVYADEGGSNTLTAIDPTTNSILGNLTVGKYPTTLAYISGLDELFVGTQPNVTIVNASQGKVVGWVDTAPSSVSMAYDATRGTLYVGNLTGFRNRVTAIDVRNRTVGSSLAVQFPLGLAIDPVDGTVFIGNITRNLTEWNVTAGTTRPLAVGAESEALLWTSSDQLIATDTLVDALYDIESTPTVRLYNATFTATPDVTIVGTPVQFTLDASGGVGTLTYSYSGLPVGCAPSGASFLCNVTSPGTYTILGTISDSAGDAVTQTLLLWVGGGRPVWLNESGLAAGATWGVGLAALGGNHSTTGGSIMAPLPDGVYRFGGWTTQAGGGNPIGLFQVAGTPTGVTVPFAGAGYEVQFLESGLPTGTTWEVRLSNGDSASAQSGEIDLREPNGSYTYVATTGNLSYRAAGGSVDVTGATAHVAVAYSLVTYAITFTETGISIGLLWSVDVAGSRASGYVAQLVVSEPNGTYAWSAVTTDPGYAPVTGSVAVGGSAQGVTVSFSSAAYLVTVTESGLPTGSPWWFNLTAIGPYSSHTTIVELNLSSGSYPYSVGAAPGYAPTPPSGTVNVTDGPVSMSVVFTLGGGKGGAPLVLSRFSADPGTLVLGGTTNLSVTPAGGMGTYSYDYLVLPPGCSSADRPSILCTPNETGTFPVEVIVRDSTGHSAFGNLSVTISSPGGGGGGLGSLSSGIPLTWVFVGVAAVAVAAIAGFLLRPSRRRGRPSEANAPAPPETEEVSSVDADPPAP